MSIIDRINRYLGVSIDQIADSLYPYYDQTVSRYDSRLERFGRDLVRYAVAQAQSKKGGGDGGKPSKPSIPGWVGRYIDRATAPVARGAKAEAEKVVGGMVKTAAVGILVPVALGITAFRIFRG